MPPARVPLTPPDRSPPAAPRRSGPPPSPPGRPPPAGRPARPPSARRTSRAAAPRRRPRPPPARRTTAARAGRGPAPRSPRGAGRRGHPAAGGAQPVRQAAHPGAGVVGQVGQHVGEVRAGAEQRAGGHQPDRRGRLPGSASTTKAGSAPNDTAYGSTETRWTSAASCRAARRPGRAVEPGRRAPGSVVSASSGLATAATARPRPWPPADRAGWRPACRCAPPRRPARRRAVVAPADRELAGQHRERHRDDAGRPVPDCPRRADAATAVTAAAGSGWLALTSPNTRRRHKGSLVVTGQSCHARCHARRGSAGVHPAPGAAAQRSASVRRPGRRVVAAGRRVRDAALAGRARAALVPPATRPGAVLVDLGCGGGLLAPHLAGKGYRHVGVDLTRSALRPGRRARRARGPGRRDRGAAAPTAAPTWSAPARCWSTCRTWPRVVAEACRLLRPGGLLVLDTLNATALARLVAVTVGERMPGVRRAASTIPACSCDAAARWSPSAPGTASTLRVRGIRPAGGRCLAAALAAWPATGRGDGAADRADPVDRRALPGRGVRR